MDHPAGSPSNSAFPAPAEIELSRGFGRAFVSEALIGRATVTAQRSYPRQKVDRDPRFFLPFQWSCHFSTLSEFSAGEPSHPTVQEDISAEQRDARTRGDNRQVNLFD
jgi:hypothetical protein